MNGRKVSWRQPGESHLVSEAAGASVVANRTEHRLWVLEMAVGKKVRDLAAAAHSPGSLICIKAESAQFPPPVDGWLIEFIYPTANIYSCCLHWEPHTRC